MRPKYSTGFLTPQTKNKRISKVKRTESNENLNSIKDLSDSFFEKLMSCPIKRQLVLTLINSEKDNIEEYKRNRANEKKRKEVDASPLLKIKRNFQCESPTALFRRRALEQKNRQNDDNKSECTSESNSTHSSASSCPSPIPFNKLLNGVVAYVEIKSKDQDRSSGAKALLRAMGATTRDKFTKDVTHVIFKDGSFTTYQKAKLMKVHLVSVLWIEAVRSNNMRVPEKKFPAWGTDTYDSNVSSMCSQMQKEYEGLIRDELHRSMVQGTPLPSTQALIDRRRTLMTPVPSSSHKLSQQLLSSQDIEVQTILRSRRKTYAYSDTTKISADLLSDDDSDLGPFINGTNIRRRNSSLFPNLLNSNTDKNFENKLEDSNMDLTFLEKSMPLKDSIKPDRSNFCQNAKDSPGLENNLISDDSYCEYGKENCIPNTTIDESIYNKNTPKLEKINSMSVCKTIRDEEFNVPEDTRYRRRTRLLCSNSETNLNTNENGFSTINVPVLESPHRLTGLQILSKNVCSPRNDIAEDNVALHSFNKASTVTAEKSSSTNMSSLQISLNKEQSDTGKVNVAVETSTSMSTLLISSDSLKDKSTGIANNKNSESNDNVLELDVNKKLVEQVTSFNGKDSFSPINSIVINDVLQLLDVTPPKDENITKRRKRQAVEIRTTYNTRRKSVLPVDINKTGSDSDGESEIDTPAKLSPAKKGKNNNLPISSPNDFCNKSGNKKEDTKIQKKAVQLNHASDDAQFTPQNKKGKIKFTVKKTQSLKKTSKKHNNSNVPKQAEQSCTLDSSDSGSNKKLNKTRKLYNPDESIKEIITNDESERQRNRNNVKKRKSDEGVVLNCNIVTISPNTLITAKAKEFVDKNNINLKDILNQEAEIKATLPKNKKPKKVNQIARNSEADEQRQLAAEFTNKQNEKSPRKTIRGSTAKKQEIIQRRQSARLSQNPRRKLNLDSSSSSSDEKCIVPVTPLVNRRSTMEFQTKSQMSSNNKLKIDKNKRPSIVCTKLHKEDIQIFNQIVRKLGGFVIEDEVSSKTTHLVAGEPKRTINMLRAVAMGCWILKHEWLLRSLEEGKWLPEEDFEETDFSPAVQQCRLQRQAFGPSYTMDIFQDCGPIYVARGTTPRCSDLKELIILCKGNICTIPRNADIVVGEYVRYEGVICVKEAWVLDSVTFNKKMSVKKYLITPSNCSPVV